MTVTLTETQVIVVNDTEVTVVTAGIAGTDAPTITAKNEGTNLTTSMTSIDFVGAGVNATNSGGAVTVTIDGGGAGLADGDKGDITVSGSGTTWTIDNGLNAAKISGGSVSNTEFDYLNGVTSAIQTQLDGKSGTSHTHTASQITDFSTAADARITAQKGQNDGLASLDSGGKVPSSQLPSYVDDVLEYANLAAFPATGSAGLIYVALDTGKTYRWSGSAYAQIAAGDVNSVFGRTGVVTAQSGDYTTAQVTESGNLYFTAARAIGSVLTGFAAGAGVVAATDTILQAFNKIVGNIAALTTAAVPDSSNKRYVTDAQLTVIGNTSGTNTGDQTSIVGITGTKAQFDTAVTDGNFLYVGDVTQYTDEMAQDAVGGMLLDTNDIDLIYSDATPSLSANLLSTAITAKTGVTPVGADYILISDTSDSGNLKKALISDLSGGGGGGSPGGSDTQVQFNDGGAFGGSSKINFNKTTGATTIDGTVVITNSGLTDTVLAKNYLRIGQAVGAQYSYITSDNTLGMSMRWNSTSGNGVAFAAASFIPTANGVMALGENGYGWNALQLATSGGFSGAIYPTAAGVLSVRNALNTSDASFRIGTAYASVTPLIIKGAASQTANLFEAQNSSSTVRTSISNDGQLVLNADGGAITIAQLVQFSGTTYWKIGTTIENNASTLQLDATNARINLGGGYVYYDVSGGVARIQTFNELRVLPGALGGTGTRTMSVIAQNAGQVPFAVQGAASQTSNLEEWRNSAGTALSYIRADGSCKPASLADSSAANDSIYYSTTASKLVYKDSGGTVNALY